LQAYFRPASDQKRKMRSALALGLCGLMASLLFLSMSVTAVAQQQTSVVRTTATTAKPVAAKSGQTQVKKPSVHRQPVVRQTPPSQVSVGTRLGLRAKLSEIALNSSAVLVMDQESQEVLLEKNPDVVLPIASITKLMTALVTLDADLPLDELITITQADARLERSSSSRLQVGARLTRAELLHLALMSSENRAAQALGRTYPGGLAWFISEMNEKARTLGMNQTRFSEPTGLSSHNTSSARDLALLVHEAYQFPLIREYSTAREAFIRVRGQPLQYRNSNALARGDQWALGLSKTGFIRDAGRCLVMQAVIDDQPVIIVMLDAQAKDKRIRDAENIRRWLSSSDRQADARS